MSMEYTITQGFRKYKHMLESVSNGILGDAGQDIVSEFFYILLKNGRTTFKNEVEFKVYSIAGVRNLTINMIHRDIHHKYIKNTALFNPDWFPDITDIESEIQKQIDPPDKEIMALTQALEKMKPGFKEVIKLTYQGKVPKEIAQDLKLNARTVCNMHYRGMDILRAKLLSRYQIMYDEGSERIKQRFLERMRYSSGLVKRRSMKVRTPAKKTN